MDPVMDPVIIVCGKWVMENRFVFNADKRGCRVLDVNDQTTYDALVQMVMEDYGFGSGKIQLSYMFSNKVLKKMPPDTPPVYVENTRQFQAFLRLRKTDQLRLCVEVSENDVSEGIQKDESVEKMERPRSHVSKGEFTEGNEEYIGSYEECIGSCSRPKSEETSDEEDDEDDEFDSRFDIIDDPDGASSEDDNFSLYGKSTKEDDEDSPTLPPKKRAHNNSLNESKGAGDIYKVALSSINIVVGQRYDTKEDLVLRLKLLTVRDRFDFEVPVSTPTKLVVTCWVNGCRWRVCASTQGISPEFYVRAYDSEHSCSVTERSNRSRQATANVLGALYRDFLGDIDPSVRPRHVGVAITKQFGIKMDYWKSHRTLKFARQIDLGTPEKGYEDLPSYLHMIRMANPGTVTHLDTDEIGRFKYLFIAFGATVTGFAFMRKVVIVDGTFLHGKYKGTLLTAMAQDGNFQIFPIAFGVVDTENDSSWQWFFTQLETVIPDEKGLAIISDRHKSIGKAIGIVYPLAARGICTYHLHKNMMLQFRGGDLFRMVKKAAKCYRTTDFDEVFAEIEARHPPLHAYLQRADVRMWTRVHFPGNRYNLMTTNIAESMNKVLINCRSYPIVRLLESIRTMMTRWFAERREDARLMKTTLTRGVENLLETRVSGAKLAVVQNIDSRHVQVTCGSSLHVVNLEAKRCTCRRFDKEKLPCVHAIAAAETRNVSRISLCDPYYSSDYLVNGYAGSIMPVDSAFPVPEDVAKQLCMPPVVRERPGRPTKSRIKSRLEKALEKKRPRKQHACSRCNKVGHNVKTCQA